MTPRRKVENLLALAVLGYLTQRPMHPYELSRTLRDNDDARSFKFSHGSLYMVFGQLSKAGLIVEQETRREGQRPERTLYAITDAGRTEFREWLGRLLAEPRHEYPHFVAALAMIAALPPDQVVDFLRERLTRLAGQRSACQEVIDQALAAELHPLFLVEEEYRIAMLDAETAYVTRLIGQITDPAAGWGPLWAQFHSQAATDGRAP
ncbi:MAG TPA: PadR family transcriptional regulator [Streptosporangiaceae bacterium]|jgi:DNA-binding PadR family transcriptional regulator